MNDLALITQILSLTALLLFVSFKFWAGIYCPNRTGFWCQNTLYDTSFNVFNTFYLCIDYCGVS